MAEYDYLTARGVIVPDTSTLLIDVEAEYRAALGADLVTSPSTPQGAMIAAEVIARTGVLENNAAVANQINPNLAEGVFLDAIWALTGGQRLASTRSVVPGAVLAGLPGVVIDAGSRASLADGTLFETVSGVVLDGFGAGVVDFQAVDPGPIAVAPGALQQIVTAVLGWDSVTNPTAATLGRDEESDMAARLRRRRTLSLQNVALPEAITSALYDTPNVRSLTFRENPTGAVLMVDGVSLVPHSIFVCVDGGTDTDVAATLLANKSLGCAWNGAVTVAVTEPSSGQVYSVKFSRPTAVPVQARLYVRNTGALSDIQTSVRDVVAAFAAVALEVGANVSAFELASAAAALQGVFVTKCEISLLTPVVWSTNEIVIDVDEIATLLTGDIAVFEL